MSQPNDERYKKSRQEALEFYVAKAKKILREQSPEEMAARASELRKQEKKRLAFIKEIQTRRLQKMQTEKAAKSKVKFFGLGWWFFK
jgi:hypothetical protein